MTQTSHSQRSNDRRELALTAGMLVLTVIATVLLARDILATATSAHAASGDLARLLLFSVVVGCLIHGNIIFQASRLGHLVRRLGHVPPAFESIVAEHLDTAEPITILVPSYREDARTIRQTLTTAALQHHPDANVVLLLDDPASPRDGESARMLRAAARVPAEIEAMLRTPRNIVSRASLLASFPAESPRAGLKRLLGVYDELIHWFERSAASTPINDHTDAHFVQVAFRSHRNLLERRAQGLVHGLALGDPPTANELAREYRRLLAVFSPQITVFQRKRYSNVSHEPSKAANLNTYIGLMGTRITEVEDGDELLLCESDAAEAFRVPAATYVLTLDADSLVLPEYALRLASVFEAPGNDRVAVVLTPYSAIPRPPRLVERIAGATTDVQYTIHQGFTYWRATFWVGANALLRKRALDDIRTETCENGVTVTRYIQDRTVIEDTESTIDLARKGWSLINFPERLAFSATPPDFGSLLIQRTRWANGGLLILPKAVRLLAANRFQPGAITSFLVRLHYLTSIATGSIGLLILLFLPLETELNSVWLPLTALPYFLLYWRELSQRGYHRGDILRVYAFNLMLIPINLAGVVKSLQQGLTGARVPFGRTPKVSGRTSAPRWAVLSLWGLLMWCVTATAFDLHTGRWMHALFALGIGVMLAYAITAFVGLRESWEDARLEQAISLDRLASRIGVPASAPRNDDTPDR
jgi:cellulose synthase (UDP-forming)